MKYFYFLTLLVAISFQQNAQVTMVTNMPPVVAPGADLKVEVKINKGTVGNFAKYEMTLPEGFSAVEKNSKTGYFTFEKKIVKIVWVTLPGESEFIVSFKVQVPSAVGPYILYHKFSYIDNGVKKEVNGQQIDLKIDASGVSKTLSYLPDEPEVPVANTNTTPVTTTTLPPISNPTNTIATAPTVAATTPTLSASGNSITTNSVGTSVAQSGITYLVQIGTFGADPGKSKYSDLGKVTVEKDGSVYKVLIGEYANKDEALKKRDELVTKGYNGFLVKYQNGQRIK